MKLEEKNWSGAVSHFSIVMYSVIGKAHYNFAYCVVFVDNKPW